MSTHWIVGTAGHIDHGKTSLVKALTGQNTDRLKEEQERGISIELGFAHLDLPGGVRAGVVDVPGHERFVRTMLAGAHGMDLVLFTVAADDGVMPQTVEHLDILHLLGVERAIFVITKSDLASEARILEVTEEIRALTGTTTLQGSPVVPFSFVSGEGLTELREQIGRVFAQGGKPKPNGAFRLPVDRAFASPGHGLIVTGTAISGEVRPGDRVRCLPGGDLVRVRSVEVHNEPARGRHVGPAARAEPDRCHARSDRPRRHHLRRSDHAHVRPVRRPNRGAAGGGKRHQEPSARARPPRHVGAHGQGDCVRTARARPLRPDDRAYCQIELTEPFLALRGDRFILRDETAQRTIAGGTVVWPAAPKHKRGDPSLAARLEAFDHGDERVIVESLAREGDELGGLAAPTVARPEPATGGRARARGGASRHPRVPPRRRLACTRPKRTAGAPRRRLSSGCAPGMRLTRSRQAWTSRTRARAAPRARHRRSCGCSCRSSKPRERSPARVRCCGCPATASRCRPAIRHSSGASARCSTRRRWHRPISSRWRRSSASSVRSSSP